MQTGEETKSIKVIRRALDSTRRPDITFHRNGRIDITARVSRHLGLKDGDVIDLLDDGNDWHMYVRSRSEDVRGRHEGQCRATNPAKRCCHNFRTYSKKICDLVLGMSGGDVARIIAGQFCCYGNVGKTVLIIPQYDIDKR